jgi:hypothetical protein
VISPFGTKPSLLVLTDLGRHQYRKHVEEYRRPLRLPGLAAANRDPCPLRRKPTHEIMVTADAGQVPDRL